MIPNRTTKPSRKEIRLAGTGGQGLVLAGLILAEAAAVFDGKNAVQTQSYGPEARGGSSKSDVVISKKVIHFPKCENPDVLLCLSQKALDDNLCFLKENGFLLADADLVNEIPDGPWRVHKIPFTKIAREAIGKVVVANIVSLGAISAITKVVSLDALKEATKKRLPAKVEEMNMKALDEGYKAGLEAVGEAEEEE